MSKRSHGPFYQRDPLPLVGADNFARGKNIHPEPLMGRRAKKGVVEIHHSLVEPTGGGRPSGLGARGGGLHTRRGSALSARGRWLP